jgi:DNA-binding CsgD family transcriptional regulator
MVAPIPSRLGGLLPKMSRRKSQTLKCLLRGLSEKQIALELGISRHTIHVYVKELHKQFGVASRGELLARWISDPDEDQISSNMPVGRGNASEGAESLTSLIARRAMLVAEIAHLDLKLVAAAQEFEGLQRKADERRMSLGA